MASVFYRPPPSLQEDLLHYIFEQVSHSQTLAHASVVCRAWLMPAQAALYKEIEYSPLARRPREALLARTLRTRPHLLCFVRRLSLATIWTHSPIPELCDWIARIPENHLHEFRWTWDRGHPLPALLHSPAVRAARHIELKGRLYSFDTVQSVLELPSIQSLSIELKGGEKGCLPERFPTRLRHLNVMAYHGHSRSLSALLAAVGPNLESLRLACKLGADPDEDSALASCIAAHCPELRRLDVEGIAPLDAPVPILDGLVRQLQSLETLSGGPGTFTDALFEEVPSSLVTFRLAFAPPLAEPLVAFLEDARRRDARLAALELVGEDKLGHFGRLAEVCRTHGVSFRTQRE
ncbi:hypothetical protein C8Q79DRAFT_935889 [Trametes meyenii]|nr:hypothetical protein C8Q79DRAFT_935889 [Trametes meyenii]